MLTLQKTGDETIISVAADDKPVEDLLSKEWLLTNSRGGYASSTIIGCNTRRYHGLLVGSLNPLANRIMGLANCLEMVIVNDQNGNGVFNLSTFEFAGKLSPEGFRYLRQFRRNIGVHFDYQLNTLRISKSVYLARDADTVAVVYDFTRTSTDSLPATGGKIHNEEESLQFVLRPFVGLRDFHTVQKSYAHLTSEPLGDVLSIQHDIPGDFRLFLSCPSMNFSEDAQWWLNFFYRSDKERGQDYTEDLWSPGFFKCPLKPPVRIVLWAALSCGPMSEAHCGKGPSADQLSANGLAYDIETFCDSLQRHHDTIRASTDRTVQGTHISARDNSYRLLHLAADQFVARRQTDKGHRTTILAGYPWFADWGRDAFISLPGLLLLTGRFDEAKSVLSTFAQAADEGMIPNRFDDQSDTAHFNSIDASLWFINASFQYLEATGDSQTFTAQLLPTIRWVIERYQNGTRFDIHADDDGLITGGNSETQLTWMDARYEGVAFTPRYGKAVEINALWYNALCRLARFYSSRDIMTANNYAALSDKVGDSFRRLFWNETAGYLNDCILPDGSADAALRPNQIFAVSVPFSPLSARQQKCVVDIVQKYLLTPYGLRTLNVDDSRYIGLYTGPMGQRDRAYHQGTVWPYLIGPFVEAWLKVNDSGRKGRKTAADFIKPLLEHLTNDGCLGQVSEIFDGDPPHKPKGCFAQAWSVAELIRAYHLINS